MISSILSTEDLMDYIESNTMILILFKANWCNGCMMLKPHYEILSAKYGSSNIKFLSADVDYIGMGKLNALKISLRFLVLMLYGLLKLE